MTVTIFIGSWCDWSAQGQAETQDIAYVISAAFAQGLVTYAAIRLWLQRRASRDELPDWLYGWAVQIANKVDDQDKLLLAYILTDIDLDEGTVMYCGSVRDIALQPEGGIARITLVDCERYLIDLRKARTDDDAEPLALFEILTLESSCIRNIAFETVPT